MAFSSRFSKRSLDGRGLNCPAVYPWLCSSWGYSLSRRVPHRQIRAALDIERHRFVDGSRLCADVHLIGTVAAVHLLRSVDRSWPQHARCGYAVDHRSHLFQTSRNHERCRQSRYCLWPDGNPARGDCAYRSCRLAWCLCGSRCGRWHRSAGGRSRTKA